jgi:WD40 repeat protein
MYRSIAYGGVVVVVVAAALSGLGVSSAGTSGAAEATPGAQLWVQRYNGPGNNDDTPLSVAVSPAGDRVFVTGFSTGVTGSPAYATVAYDTATGVQLWLKRYNGPGNGYDTAASVAVSPTGTRVFVTGTSDGAASGGDYATVAYNAATGAQVWVKRYNGPGNGYDTAASVAVSPAGTRVFVTGTSDGAASGGDYATVAYNATTGTQVWVKRYNGPGNAGDEARSVAVSPTGGTVFVTGSSVGSSGKGNYATVAYSAVTGARLWVQRYHVVGHAGDTARSVAVSPAGDKVFVTGDSVLTTPLDDFGQYATVAYNAITGTQLWAKLYKKGLGIYGGHAVAVAVAPAGDRVFVTGSSSEAASTFSDYATVAYNTATGARLWVKRYGSVNTDQTAHSMAVSPTAGTVFVTGYSYDNASRHPDYATVAYNPVTGAQLWAHRYNGPASSQDIANAIAVSPTGNRVFVTGDSMGATSVTDYATVAYRG